MWQTFNLLAMVSPLGGRVDPDETTAKHPRPELPPDVVEAQVPEDQRPTLPYGREDVAEM